MPTSRSSKMKKRTSSSHVRLNFEGGNLFSALISNSPTSDFVWIGMKTKATTRGFNDNYSNFNEDSPINGCAGQFLVIR